MKFSDLLRMSINNLRRRKLRTGLTVLGVVIGTASIVVMVSLGIGLKEITVEQYESSGSLTKIEVYRNYGMGGSENDEDGFITDKTIESFKGIPHVKAVSPVLSTYVQMRQGAYEGLLQDRGLKPRGPGGDRAGGGTASGSVLRHHGAGGGPHGRPELLGRQNRQGLLGDGRAAGGGSLRKAVFYHVPEFRSRGKRQAEKICVSCQRTCKK